MSFAINDVHHFDCIAGMRQLPEASVPLAFADPPFNIGYDYDVYDDRRAADDYLRWTREWMGEVSRLLTPAGAFWLAIGDEYAAEAKVIATRELGLTCRSWVIWYYTFGVHCRRKFTRSHAHLFHFVKNPASFTFNSEDIRVPSARQLVYGDRRANPAGRMPDDTWITPADQPPREWILRPQDLPQGFGAEGDVWYFPRVCGTFDQRAGWHGCQMPEQLLGRIIKVSSNSGDLVLDPFGGSGTTLAVAKKLGRNFIGFELSAEYVANIRARLARTQPGTALDGPANPLASAPATANGRRLSNVKAKQTSHSAQARIA